MKRIALVCLPLLIFVPATPSKQTTDRPEITYLRGLQQKDGGFVAATGKEKSSLRATSAAVRALKYFDGKVPDREACIQFVRSCYDKDSGGFKDHPGGIADPTCTAVGLMAIVELGVPLADFEPGAVKYLDQHCKSFEEIRLAVAAFEALGKKAPHNQAWLESVLAMSNKDGTFGKEKDRARDTGGAAVAVLRMGGTLADPSAVLKALNDGQLKCGGYAKPGAEPDLESCYRVARAFHMLKAKPEGLEALKGFIHSCHNRDGGYGVMPGQPSSVSGSYYAAIILNWFK